MSKEIIYSNALKAYHLADFALTITLCSELIDTDDNELVYAHDQMKVNACALRGRAYSEVFKQSGKIEYKIREMEDSLLGRFYELDEANVIRLNESAAHALAEADVSQKAHTKPSALKIDVEKTRTLSAIFGCNSHGNEAVAQLDASPITESSSSDKVSPDSVITTNSSSDTKTKNVKDKTKKKLKARAKILSDQGDEHRLNDCCSAALACYTQSIETYENLAAYKGRILLNLASGHSEAVLSDCDMIDKIDRFESLFLRGSAQIALGHYEQADLAFTNLIHIKSKKAHSLIDLKLHVGKLFRSEQQLDMAKKYILEALAIESQCTLVLDELSRLARSYELRGARKAKEGDSLNAKIDDDEAKSLRVRMVARTSNVNNNQAVLLAEIGVFNANDVDIPHEPAREKPNQRSMSAVGAFNS